MADDAAPDEKPNDPSDADAAATVEESTVAEPESGATEVTESAESVDESGEGDDSEASDEAAEVDEEQVKPPKARMSHVRLATIAGLVLVLALGGLTGWLGFRAYESHKADELRKLFLQVGRQGALNLTTIDFEHADADVQRILDSATGTFYDDFQQRSGPFIQVVKQAQSKSVGSISEAGLESSTATDARVLVAVSVKTSNAGAQDQQPRAWRMRISVQKLGDDVKVSNVEFVP